MIWVLLAALGIPLWMVAGALVTTLWSRRRFMRAPGAFAAKMRVVTGEVDGLDSSFPRSRSAARWVHDTLVIHRGVALARSDAFAIAQMTGSRAASGDAEVKGLGPHPRILTLVLDSGATVELAAHADAADTMVGPFVGVLAAEGQPSPPA
jgi:hypothetical protein